MKELLTYITIEKFRDTEIILREGSFSTSVYIIKKGKINCFRSGNLVKSIDKFTYFGDRGAIMNESSIMTCVANGNVTLWSIKNNDLSKLLNEKMIEQLKKKNLIEDEDCELGNLIVIKQIGKGNYSKVYLVSTDKGEYYALKAISHKKIQKYILYDQLLVSPI